MPVITVRQDITKMKVDAIVNAANETLLGGGGVDGAIHKAAGPGLHDELRTLNGCRTGQAKITKGYDLPARYVIHTVGPVWKGGMHNEDEDLYACYKNSLELAKSRAIESIAFPMISTGAYAFPIERAAKIQKKAIDDFLMDNDMTVYIVVFDKRNFHFSMEHMGRVREYIDEHYADAALKMDIRASRCRQMFSAPQAASYESADDGRRPSPKAARPLGVFRKNALDEKFGSLDESFSEMLLSLIDEKGMTDVGCYKRANIDRKLFSKIRSDLHYKPSKKTALALAIALELSIGETDELLEKAGLALSHAYKFDVIVEYFIVERIYDIAIINETLFYYDQPLLGA